MRNPVGISMKKDEIMIRISEGATQKETVECLNKKIPELKKLYKSEKTPICVVGKVLKNKEIEEIRRRDERLLNLKEDILNMGPNQFVLGGYVNTIYESDPIDNNKIRVIHDRKYRREYTRKAYQEFRKKMKENRRTVLENG